MKILLNDLARHVQQNKQPLMAAVERVLDRGWFVLGPESSAFESAMCKRFGLEHAVAVANGTDALELAVRGLGIAAGDEVIIAPNAGMYAATALAAVGATAVYADVDDQDLNLSPESVAARITDSTRAVIVTHLYGRMADMTAFDRLREETGVKLIEDCAQAIGAEHHGVSAGAFGDCACFSFYPTKNLGALGDGGMVACRDATVTQRLQELRQYGWARKYVVSGIVGSRNSRLDELQAAILLAQMSMLDEWNKRRREIARRYAEVQHPLIRHPRVTGTDYVAHLYVIRTPEREHLKNHLASHGVASDIHYPVLDTKQLGFRGSADVPVAEKAVSEILTLPCYPELRDDEIELVCDALSSWSC